MPLQNGPQVPPKEQTGLYARRQRKAGGNADDCRSRWEGPRDRGGDSATRLGCHGDGVVQSGVDIFLEEYQELSEKEQEDLERLLMYEEEKSKGVASGIQDIEAFTKNLSEQLSQLDEANIHTLMDSETQIHSLMLMIDKTILEIKVS